MRPSPARLAAPEPDVWLPMHLTAAISVVEDVVVEAEIDFTGEVELLNLEEGRIDLDRELEELESAFWRSAEADHPFLTGELPVAVAAPEPEPAATVAEPTPAPEPVATGAPVSDLVGAEPEPYRRLSRADGASSGGEPRRSSPTVRPTVSPMASGVADKMAGGVAEEADLEPLPVPEEYTQVRPNRPAIARHRRAVRLRKRIMATLITVAVATGLIGATARAFGGDHPRRDVTVSIDGRASSIVTRAGTVGDLLAAEGVVLHRGDRVIPPASSALRQGMPIHIARAFPLTLDVDGVVQRRRTTHHSVGALRRQFKVPAAMVLTAGAGRVRRHSALVFRTPHDGTLAVDGTTTPLTKETALTVGELLAARKIAVGPQDQVDPAPATRLTPGFAVHVYRLSDDTVVETKIIPYTTQYQDNPALAAGHTSVIRAGRNGTTKVITKVTRKDGQIVQWGPVIGTDVITAPVTQILARGTKLSGTQKAPPAPAAASPALYQSGTATWYDSHAGSGSCAHLRLPMGTLVKIVASNGRTATCRVGDRGPEAWTGNIIDLNRDVFAQLAPLGTGRLSVSLYIVG